MAVPSTVRIFLTSLITIISRASVGELVGFSVRRSGTVGFHTYEHKNKYISSVRIKIRYL
jgi:hypothetical protein